MDNELHALACRHPYRYTYDADRYYRQRYFGVGALKVLGCLEVFRDGQWQPVTSPAPIRKAA